MDSTTSSPWESSFLAICTINSFFLWRRILGGQPSIFHNHSASRMSKSVAWSWKHCRKRYGWDVSNMTACSFNSFSGWKVSHCWLKAKESHVTRSLPTKQIIFHKQSSCMMWQGLTVTEPSSLLHDLILFFLTSLFLSLFLTSSALSMMVFFFSHFLFLRIHSEARNWVAYQGMLCLRVQNPLWSVSRPHGPYICVS